MATIPVNELQHGAIINMASKDNLVISLPINAGTGYTWQLPESNLFTITEKTESASDNLPGAAAKQVITIKPKLKRPAKEQLVFSLKRGWETAEEPAKKFAIVVVISPPRKAIEGTPERV